MSDDLKSMIDILQNHTINCKTNNILLIFDNYSEMKRYRQKCQFVDSSKYLITIDELLYKPNVLFGLRFCRFHFVTYGDIKK